MRGAYDFLENPLVSASAVAESIFSATADRAGRQKRVLVAVDGSSLALGDYAGGKGFGSVGSPNKPVKGLMVMNALAVTTDGVPLGLIDQIFWNREAGKTGLSAGARSVRNGKRPFEDKETSYLVDAARNAKRRLEAVGVAPWVVIDREGDNRDILLRLHEEGLLFTIRARWDHPEMMASFTRPRPARQRCHRSRTMSMTTCACATWSHHPTGVID